MAEEEVVPAVVVFGGEEENECGGVVVVVVGGEWSVEDVEMGRRRVDMVRATRRRCRESLLAICVRSREREVEFLINGRDSWLRDIKNSLGICSKCASE